MDLQKMRPSTALPHSTEPFPCGLGTESPCVAPLQLQLLDWVRHKIRLTHRSNRTEKAHVDWVRRYEHFLGLHHPGGRGAQVVEGVLNQLAVEGKVAAAMQKLTGRAQLDRPLS